MFLSPFILRIFSRLFSLGGQNPDYEKNEKTAQKVTTCMIPDYMVHIKINLSLLCWDTTKKPASSDCTGWLLGIPIT